MDSSWCILQQMVSILFRKLLFRDPAILLLDRVFRFLGANDQINEYPLLHWKLKKKVIGYIFHYLSSNITESIGAGQWHLRLLVPYVASILMTSGNRTAFCVILK